MYGHVDRTKYVVRTRGRWLTPSGFYEIVASFEFKGDAEQWARQKFGARWRKDYQIVRRTV